MQMWSRYAVDGVTEYMDEAYERKLDLEQRLRQLFHRASFREVEFSALAYYDAYQSPGNFAPQEHLIKTQDENGRLLVLRYDGTVPAARLATTQLKDDIRPLKLSYIGRMYRMGETGGGRMKEFTQAGLERMGPASVLADAEMIALAISSMRAVGFESIMVNIGHVHLLRTVLAADGCEDSVIDTVIQFLDERNEVAIRTYLDQANLPNKSRVITELLLTSNASWSSLERIRELSYDASTLSILDELTELASLLEAWGLLTYCRLDLKQQAGMKYYSGLIFKAYSYGSPFPLLSGGRYDEVLEAFGKTEAAIGFSLGVDLCLQALERQERLTDSPSLFASTSILLVPHALNCHAWPLAERIRASGERLDIWTAPTVTGKTEDECKLAMRRAIEAIKLKRQPQRIYLLRSEDELEEV